VKNFVYEYDFGDGWEVDVKIEKALDQSQLNGVAVCLEGERAGPLEDSGGPGGYMHTLEILGDANDAEHEETRAWADSIANMVRPTGPFDPEHFDLEATNKLLARLKTPK